MRRPRAKSHTRNRPQRRPAFEVLEDRIPVAESLAETSLSLPIYPGITESQIAYVVEQVRAFFDG